MYNSTISPITLSKSGAHPSTYAYICTTDMHIHTFTDRYIRMHTCSYIYMYIYEEGHDRSFQNQSFHFLVETF